MLHQASHTISNMKIVVFLFFLLILVGCSIPDYKQARLVNIGTTTDELETIMGEPFSIEINSGDEEWFFTYSSPSGRREGMVVTIIDKKVVKFYSY